MQTNAKYQSTQLSLIDRYVEVEVIDDFGNDEWIGNLFGFNVQGTGGSGDQRGCKVTKISDGTIYVKGFNQRGNPSWDKIKTIVEEKLASKMEWFSFVMHTILKNEVSEVLVYFL